MVIRVPGLRPGTQHVRSKSVSRTQSQHGACFYCRCHLAVQQINNVHALLYQLFIVARELALRDVHVILEAHAHVPAPPAQ